VHPEGLFGFASPSRAVTCGDVILPRACGYHRAFSNDVIADDTMQYGASGRIRTFDRSVRSRVLYPAELRMHRITCALSCFSLTNAVLPDNIEKSGASGRIIRLRLTLSGHRLMATLSFLVPAAITALSVMTSSLTTLCNMVHPEGFEPSTARFVAEYSIQLSYGCTELLVR
jgi:hypothetical protein